VQQGTVQKNTKKNVTITDTANRKTENKSLMLDHVRRVAHSKSFNVALQSFFMSETCTNVKVNIIPSKQYVANILNLVYAVRPDILF